VIEKEGRRGDETLEGVGESGVETGRLAGGAKLRL
jgi:hypothetical protein